MTAPLNVTIQSHDGQEFGAYYAKAGGNAPTLIIIQEIFGVNNGLRQMCDAWTQKGYHAICPDLFWRQERGIELSDQTESEWQRAFSLYNGFDVNLGLHDLQSTLSFVRRQPENNGKAASIGFCLGGKLAFLMAAQSDADCTISYYGVGLDGLLDQVPQIKKPLLMHFAELDKFVNPEAREKIFAALASNKAISPYLYKGVDHAFSRLNGSSFNKEADALAGQRTDSFLKVHLGSKLN